MSTKITLFSLLFCAVHGYNTKNYDTALLMSFATITSIIFHYELYEHARFFDVIICQPTVIYYFLKWIYYECYYDDRLAIFLWMLGLCLYMLGVLLNSNILHSLMHLSFAYSAILLHNLINEKNINVTIKKTKKKKLKEKNIESKKSNKISSRKKKLKEKNIESKKSDKIGSKKKKLKDKNIESKKSDKIGSKKKKLKDKNNKKI